MGRESQTSFGLQVNSRWNAKGDLLEVFAAVVVAAVSSVAMAVSVAMVAAVVVAGGRLEVAAGGAGRDDAGRRRTPGGLHGVASKGALVRQVVVALVQVGRGRRRQWLRLRGRPGHGFRRATCVGVAQVAHQVHGDLPQGVVGERILSVEGGQFVGTVHALGAIS